MPAPVDLTDTFGEGWCVTVAPLPVEQTLGAMGVAAPVSMPDGLETVTQRLIAPTDPADPTVLLLAKQAEPGWTVVLELEGTTGWIGMDPDVLAELTAESGPAGSIMANPNQVVAMFAEDGWTRGGLNAVTGLRWGSFSDRLDDALAAAGFPDDDEPSEELTRWSFSQAAVLALQAATGVRLHDDLIRSGPWTAGYAATPR